MTPSELVKCFFERVYNRKDFAYVVDIFAEDYYEHTETGVRGSQDCQNIIEGAYLVFPDLKVEINDVISREDQVAARLTFPGTQRDTFFGVPASGKTSSSRRRNFSG